jgi:hypothetical protein
MAQTDEKELAQKRLVTLINEVASTVQIVDVKLRSFSARFDSPSEEGQLVVEVKCMADGRIEGLDHPQIVVLTDFVMEARPDANQSGEPCCEVRARIALTYDSPKAAEFSSEHLSAFAQGNGIYNAWPYWREFLQSSTVRMGLPPFILPSFRPGNVSHGKTRAPNELLTASDESIARK